MKPHSVLSLQEQEALLLAKKREIEQRALESRQSGGGGGAVKTQPVAPRARTGASAMRHRALLRSGMIMKKASTSRWGAKPKQKCSVFEESSDEVRSIMKDLESSEGAKLPTSVVPSPPPCADDPPGLSPTWFQEAVARARQKAAMAASSQVPPAVAVPSVPVLPAPTRPAPPSDNSYSVASLSVPTTVMKMVGDGEHLDAIKGVMLTRLTKDSPAIVAYARQVFGCTESLSDFQWRQCQDQIKMNVVFQLLQAKKVEAERLENAGRVKYEYDSDEELDDEGTWEHKRRKLEMQKTQNKAEELTERSAGKHHIGDFLPPEELQKFMEKFSAIREGRDPDFSDYRDNKLTSDNIGFKMLRSMGWTEGKGLGSDAQGIVDPVNTNARGNNHGLGVEVPTDLYREDTEYDAYRKRMMLSYRFRPNPLNNPRRPYY